MARDEIFEAPVERIAAGGEGLVRRGGQVYFVPFAAAGDLLRCRITEERKGWGRAEIEGVIAASPDRIEPACPLFGLCGGCSLQHLSYTAQTAGKISILDEAFRRLGGFSALPEIQARPSPPWEYRNRIQLRRSGVAGESGPAWGFKARKSGEVVPLPLCPAAVREINRALEAGNLRAPDSLDRFTVYARGETFLAQGGNSRGRVPVLDREILMDAGLFFQSNAVMMEELIRDLLALSEQADSSLPMADLYTGVGIFSAFLSRRFQRIDLVEADRAALDLARENAGGKGNRFFPQRDDDWARGRKGGYGFIVVDPPRTGLGSALREWLSQEGPPLLAYVSCDPATLARDSRSLCLSGYALESLTFYDFYPQTAHIETLAVFTRSCAKTGGGI